MVIKEVLAMGMMDDMQTNLSGMSDEQRARYDELQSMEQDGTIDDAGRTELQQMRGTMSGSA